ncbi:hypothetical protein [Dietzia sp. CH92]|nr:hypothetical protein [Dietzia sp. CH92]
MGSLAGSAEAVGDDFLDNLMAVLFGADGLVGALFGSIGELIGVGGAAT